MVDMYLSAKFDNLVLLLSKMVLGYGWAHDGHAHHDSSSSSIKYI